MLLRTSAVTLALLAGCGRTELVEDAGVDGGVDAGHPGCAAMGVSEADAELMRRWNLAVDAGTQTLDFHWRIVTDFPHPTFRTGSPLAYDEFSDVLVRFWADSTTVKFAGCYDLFDRAYKSGPTVAVQKTVKLRPLTLELSTFSYIDAARRDALVHACMVIGC
jgi:hypothetical protein